MYRDPESEGTAPPLWEKAVWFGAFATNLYRDDTDEVILWAAVAIMVWSAWRAWKSRRNKAEQGDTPPIVGPFVVFTLAYFATPMVLVGTHLIFPLPCAMGPSSVVCSRCRGHHWRMQTLYACGL